MIDSISGLWVALVTPLDADGGVSHTVFAAHARHLLAAGCDGVVPFGTTGEGTSFSADERIAATEALLQAGIPADRIALGIGCPAIPDTIALARAALGLGINHALLLPPYFYRDVTGQGIEDAFARTLDGIGDARLRATLYHIPQVSGVPVPPDIVLALRRRYGRILAGVKDSSGDFAQFKAFRATAPDVPILVGNEADIGRALAAGGAGTICGLGNIVPAMVRAMFREPAAEEAMRAAIAPFMTGPFVPNLKTAMAAMTGETAFGRVRPPLRAADPAVGEQIALSLRKLDKTRLT